MTPFPLCGIILAAGRSTRMGEKNKLLLDWNNTTVLESIIYTLMASSLAEILVITRHQHQTIRTVLAPYLVHIVHNSHYNSGLSTSIKAGVMATLPCAGYLFFLGDMPLINTLSIKQLCQVFICCKDPAKPIIVPTWEGKKGNPVIFSQIYHNDLLALSGDQGARSLLQQYVTKKIMVPLPDPGVHIDIDTPQMYQKVQKNI